MIGWLWFEEDRRAGEEVTAVAVGALAAIEREEPVVGGGAGDAAGVTSVALAAVD